MAARLGDRCRGTFVGNFHTLASRCLVGPEGSGTLAGILDEEDTGLFLDQAVADVIRGWRPRSAGELPTGKTIERLRERPQTGRPKAQSATASTPRGSSALEASELRKAAVRLTPWVDQVCAGCPDVVIESSRRLFHASTSLPLDDRQEFHGLAVQSLAQPEAPLPWMRLLQLCGAASSLKDARGLLHRMRECGILPHWLLGDRSGASALPWLDLIALLAHGRLVVFDTETTGTNVAEDDILQFAAVELIDGRPRREFVVYLRSDRDFGDSVAVHGITPEQLAEKGMDRREGLDRIVGFLGDDPLVAHNLIFDRFMLDANLARVGIEPPRSSGRYCTLEIARALDPQAPSHKLGRLLERHGLEGDNSHDALDDVRATLPLLRLIGTLGLERRAKAEAFLADIPDVLRRLEAPLPRLWLRRRAAWLKQTDFNELYDELMRELPERAYETGHRRDLENKLLRHMRRTCPPATLQDLLQRRLPPYLLYREPDLILDEDCLVVSTVHRAKGLEFDSVLIPGCTDNNYPSWFAAREGENAIREEARLLYVAMSRSRGQLVISWPNSTSNASRRVFATIPSRFLAGIRTDFRHCDIPGDRIRRSRDRFTCPNCGHSFRFDGSRRQDRRCFECGHISG